VVEKNPGQPEATYFDQINKIEGFGCIIHA
jgi:hypothetical protein